MAKWILSALLIFDPRLCFSQITDMDRRAFNDFASNYRKLSTLSQLIEEAPIPMADYIFIRNKIEGDQDQKLPKIEILADGLQFDSKGSIVTLKVVSRIEQRFLLNNRPLDLSNTKPPEKWRLIEQALPNENVFLWDFFLPRAHAILPLVAAAFAVLVAMGTLKGWGQSACKNIKVARDSCMRLLREAATYAVHRHNQAARLAAKQPIIDGHPENPQEINVEEARAEKWKKMVQGIDQWGVCPNDTDDLGMDNDMSKEISHVLSTKATETTPFENWLPDFASEFLWCSDSKDKMQIDFCTWKLGYLARGICFKLTPGTITDETGLEFKIDKNIANGKSIPDTKAATPPPAAAVKAVAAPATIVLPGNPPASK